MTDTTSPLVDELEVRRALKSAVVLAGGSGEFGEKACESKYIIDLVARGDRPPSERILKALGFERVLRYRQVRAQS